MPAKEPRRFKTISEYHHYMGLPGPEHPLISLIPFDAVKAPPEDRATARIFDFYSVALKRNTDARMRYGQQDYDFTSGVLFFMAPGQVFSVTGGSMPLHTGWLLLVHPDFLWGTSLVKGIRQYAYFGYAVHEALHLSVKEEATINTLLVEMAAEHRVAVDAFSQSVIVAQLELLFTYADRFYHRQFLTRKAGSHQLLMALEELLDNYFNSTALAAHGLPTVQYVAAQLHLSPNYLGSMLRVLTGQNTQQHIHEKLIEKAKEVLSTTSLSISEIAYALGFEHPQSFSKLFKAKTTISPLSFRQSFN